MMDYLYKTPYRIRQGKDMYHFSCDSELLGRFLTPRPEDTVLDIGTNNGVLLLYAFLHGPKSLSGIDLFDEVIELAKENLEQNGAFGDLRVCSLQEYEGGPFSLVVCNPPFFTSTKESLKSRNPYRRAARFTDTLTPRELFVHSRRLLCSEGRLDVIYPHEMMDEILSEAESAGLYLSRLQVAYDHRRGKAKRALMEFVRRNEEHLHVLPCVYLDRLHEDGSYPEPRGTDDSEA
ncbi:MAG: methyltransferase [Solobacterium sp.]|nr:methyltransferase [Solobacterium sp.]